MSEWQYADDVDPQGGLGSDEIYDDAQCCQFGGHSM